MSLVLKLGHLSTESVKKRWFLCRGDLVAEPAVIDDRNECFTKNTSTLKKSFPKSIKNSSHNRFQKFDTSLHISNNPESNQAAFAKKHHFFTLSVNDDCQVSQSQNWTHMLWIA